MSDLAYSCEYLNVDKSCTAFSDNPKAQASRQLKCQNNQKNTCCYLCTYRLQCDVRCKYLGDTENCTTPKTEAENTVDAEKNFAVGVASVESAPVVFCFSCNAQMAWTKTRLTIDGWSGPKPAVDDKVLPVTVYLCPRCGRIEFQADVTKKEAP